MRIDAGSGNVNDRREYDLWRGTAGNCAKRSGVWPGRATIVNANRRPFA
jgi:hypothetical protein